MEEEENKNNELPFENLNIEEHIKSINNNVMKNNPDLNDNIMEDLRLLNCKIATFKQAKTDVDYRNRELINFLIENKKTEYDNNFLAKLDIEYAKRMIAYKQLIIIVGEINNLASILAPNFPPLKIE